MPKLHLIAAITAVLVAGSLIGVPAFAQESDEPENLGPNLNTDHEELGPKISPDGNTLYFVRTGDSTNLGFSSNANDQDVWYSVRQPDNTWSIARNLGAPINNRHQNGVSSITPDGNTLVVSNHYRSDGFGESGVSRARRMSTGWSTPDSMQIHNFQNKSRYVDFYLANDGNELLLAIENDSSLGGRDLYVCLLERDGTWSAPRNLGPDLNTKGQDTSPFLAADGTTLYFSSDGHGGYGGRDIFVTHRLDASWRKWSAPENLGPKINSDGFDAYYSIPAKGDYAYFATNRSGFGKGDLFRIKLQESARPRPVVLVSGHVYNQKTHAPLASTIRYEVLPGAEAAGNANSNEGDGSYRIVLPAGKRYGFWAGAEGYFSVNDNLDATAITEYRELTRDLYLAPIEVNQTVRVNNIFFESGKSELNTESFAELDRVVLFLKEHGGITITIAGHTDNVGKDDANLALSENRAKAVRVYLVDKGVEADRLKSKGFGRTVPVATNDTDEGRQQNRRVEFTITKK